jgi:hypothetical protein
VNINLGYHQVGGAELARNTLRMRLIALLVITPLLFSSQLSTSHAAAKAGAKCQKVGIKSVVGAKTFTCIKSGKKLVWNKGVRVLAVIPKTPTSFDDLVQNYEGIAYAAWSKSNAAITAATDVAPIFKALTGPNTTLAFKNPASAYDLVARLYSGYKSTSAMTVLSFSYDDREWAQEQMKQLQPKSTWQWITETACATRAKCWGGGMFSDEKANGLLVITTEVLDDNHLSGTLDAHEYLHAIQQNQMGRPTVWPEPSDWPPAWYREGQATFAQNASIYYQSFDLYLKNRKSISTELYRDSTITSEWIQEFFVTNQPSSWFNYDLGAMLVEGLTALKGPGSTMEIWKLMGTGSSFESAFEKVYGISFTKALPIMSKAIALELGRN